MTHDDERQLQVLKREMVLCAQEISGKLGCLDSPNTQYGGIVGIRTPAYIGRQISYGGFEFLVSPKRSSALASLVMRYNSRAGRSGDLKILPGEDRERGYSVLQLNVPVSGQEQLIESTRTMASELLGMLKNLH